VCALGLVLPSAPAAGAPTGYTDIPVQETGRVVEVLDGDTLTFAEDGTGQMSRIRLLGINAPEVTGPDFIHFPTDMCGGRAAEAALEQVLPKGTPVQLRAEHAESANRGRRLRYVFALNPVTGQYDRDVQQAIASAGLAMWFPIATEAALARPYRLLVDAAQGAALGIWDPSHCGPVEQPDARLSLVVVWNPSGSDQQNVNGEYVVVRNTAADPVDLSGWVLRDSSLNAWYTLPQNTILQPGDFRVVHVGSGTAGLPDNHDLYMGSAAPLFANTDSGALTDPSGFMGDGAYLLDRATAIRAYDEYPCPSSCSDPLQGKMRITLVNAKSTAASPARRANQEYVVITNVGSTSVLLDGYYLKRKASTHPINANTVLPPGGRLTVHIGRGTDTARVQYWGMPSTLLTDSADSVRLLSRTNVPISRVSWNRPTASGLHRLGDGRGRGANSERTTRQ
jgi:micrococcal nuclease